MAAFFALLSLLAAELLLRVYHQRTLRQRLPTELRAETRALTWDDIKNNYRIVCFGDSITFGEGLPYAQTYPAVLAKLLRQKQANLDAVVINAGIRGHTSVQGLARLQRDVLWYKPHIVLMAFGLNDGKLGYWPLDPIRERQICGDPSPRGRIARLLHHSHIWLTLRARTRRLLRRLGWHERPVKTRIEGEPQPRVSRRGFEMALERLIDQIEKNGCAALLLMTATPITEAFNPELEPSQQQRQLALYDDYNHIVREMAARHGVYLVDLHNIFTTHTQAELASLLAEDGVHLMPVGEQLVALSALQALQESGLPGSDPYRRR